MEASAWSIGWRAINYRVSVETVRILLLTHAFNSLSQRLWAELTERGHELSIEFDIADSVAEEAVALFQPELIIAPYLRRAIPESIWATHVCLILHPGPPGDGGPSALDWAISNGVSEWGVTIVQAEAQMDAGPVWAHASFPMRAASKASLYRHEVTDAGVHALLEAVEKFAAGRFIPERPAAPVWQPMMKQVERAIDWSQDDTATVLRKIRAADGFPGVADQLFGQTCHLFDACAEAALKGAPGDVIARRETALLRATIDGAVWIGHIKRAGGIKLPATLAFTTESSAVPPAPTFDGWWRNQTATWQDIAYEECGGVGFLHFGFYNGAMSTAQCRRLQQALAWAKQRSVRVLVLTGGDDFWSNGIHLNVIENAESPADESWANINAMNDLTLELIDTPEQITIAAVAGNTGAGGCFLARAADNLWLRDGVMLNPHYKNMGNLYGSEYWTYLLPRRVGENGARKIMQQRLPLKASRAVTDQFADALLAAERQAFHADVSRRATEIADATDFTQRLARKCARRARDEVLKPLATYRAEELAHMRRNFYGFDPSFHVARFHFVTKAPASWTPRHLARHRDLGWLTP